VFLPTTTILLNPVVLDWSIAGFADGTYDLTSKLKLTVGGRYTFERKDFTQHYDGRQLFDTNAGWGQFTPRAVLQYVIDPRDNVYVSYSRGFKSGDFNTFGTSPAPVSPETIDSYEVGLKSEPVRRLIVDVAAFYANYSNLQISARSPTLGLFELLNAASARLAGVELEVNYSPTEDITIRASGSYLAPTFKTFVGAPVYAAQPQGGNMMTAQNVSGTDLPRAPRYTFSLGPQYHHKFSFGEIGGSLNLYHSAKAYWGLDDTWAQAEYSMLNAEIYWRPTQHLRLSAWGDNLTNAVVPIELLPGSLGTFESNQKPIRGGVAVRYDF
jgi:iron complex outermembrane receptor protein